MSSHTTLAHLLVVYVLITMTHGQQGDWTTEGYNNTGNWTNGGFNNTGGMFAYCMNNWDCEGVYVCISKMCSCPSKTIYTGFGCQSDRDSGIQCSSTLDCNYYNNTQCIIDRNETSTCACPHAFQKFDTASGCRERERFDACDMDTDCKPPTTCQDMGSGSLMCMDDNYMNNTGNWTNGGFNNTGNWTNGGFNNTGGMFAYCMNNWDCEGVYVCISMMCSCPSKTKDTGFGCQSDRGNVHRPVSWRQ
ncbi:uncharacterized protein LOC127872202 [Dreissena polymorpha]|uniref:uncharacterized protein LOC127872202 n=1 Tax=Dreissena polymorpha TaxID=45954 RepID=UPI002263E510|nr:uncharacterized protein LOC127872202 [Dreissena polymorpha]